MENINNQQQDQKEKEERNTSDSRDVQPSATLEELIGGSEKSQEIKKSVESDASGQTRVETSRVEDATYPKEPEIVTNTKFTYGD